MAGYSDNDGDRILNRLRLAGWSGVALLLLAPLVAMRFTEDVVWTVSDFVAAAVLLGGLGLAIELAVRNSSNTAYRIAAGLAILGAFGLAWVNLAVGFLGDEGNPANMVFLGVLGVAVVGASLARFEAGGMGWTMFATAAAQVLVGVVAIPAGWSSPGGQGLYEVVLGTSLFTFLWVISAGLFRKAAHEQTAAGAAR